MPVEFVHDAKDPKDAYKLLMAYDGSGRRVSKTRMMKSAADSDWLVYHITHYTGIGTEVRENYNGGSTAETKVVMNLPEGLGRYMPDNAEKMGGTQIPVGEHGKYYFGARYFDPFFALWMSPDPAGQFSNPYTYGGDPVNFVDPNGEEVATAVIVGAIVGAIIGGTTAAYQCSNYGGGSCTEGVSTGAIVGAAAGAAGGAAGGAAAGAAAGAGEAAIVGGLAGGAAGNATGYVANGLLTGSDMSFGEGFRTTMIGAFSGAISGGVGSSLELSGSSWGWLGRAGGELAGNAASSLFMTAVNGTWSDFGRDLGQSLMIGYASSVLTGIFDFDPDRYDATDVNDAGLQEGDVLAFGLENNANSSKLWERIKGALISGGIMTMTGEEYSHIAVVDKQNGALGIREANGNGTNEFTYLSTIKNNSSHPYNNRPFKILGNRALNSSYTSQKSGKYNLVNANCTTQASYWTGMPYRNNPGAFARQMLNKPIYYNSTSLRGTIW